MKLHFWVVVGATRDPNNLKLADRRTSRLFAVVLTLVAIAVLALLIGHRGLGLS